MGLAPSRELYLSQRGATQLPFISRPAEDYTYTLSDIISNSQQKQGMDSPNADGNKDGGGDADINMDGYTYYYEHRVVPLTKEFFPSPYCPLFEQLWAARQSQNPRYHFQLAETWSPGALTDPATSFQTMDQLAAVSMLDEVQSFREKAGLPPSADGLSKEEQCVEAALRAVEDGDLPFGSREQLYDLLVRTTETDILYESNQGVRSAAMHLVELTEQEQMMQASGGGGGRYNNTNNNNNNNSDAAKKNNNNTSDGGGGTSGRSCRPPGASERRIRPLPCAIVLVRTLIPVDVHRNIYFAANSQRHHHSAALDRSGGDANSSKRFRATPSAAASAAAAAAASGGGAMRGIVITHNEVIAAVSATESARLVTQQRSTMRVAGESGACRWLPIRRAAATAAAAASPNSASSVPDAAIDCLKSGPTELRVVGVFGYWTMAEILQRSLFTNRIEHFSTASLSSGPDSTQQQQEAMSAIIARAMPHGVPSHMLTAVSFLEKQVGDKEQCHAYFSLCRYYAHGLRYCLDPGMYNSMSSSGAAPPSQHRGGMVVSSGDLWERFVLVYEQQQQHQQHQSTSSRGQDGVVSSSTTMMFGPFRSDIATSFVIRFSNIPQLQLCRQIRLLQGELREMYPQPLTLEELQRSQRDRNQAQAGTRKRMPKSVRAAMVAAAAAAASSPPPSYQGGSQQSGNTNTNNGGRRMQLPTALDPDAIAPPPALSPLERLQRDGIVCYIASGAVVLCLSHQASVRALHQLSYSALSETAEAICVALTTASPLPTVYRGELRQAHHDELLLQPPPDAAAAAVDENSTTNTTTAANHNNKGPLADNTSTTGTSSIIMMMGRGSGGSRHQQHSMMPPTAVAVALEEVYCNALRYSRNAAAGFPKITFTVQTTTSSTDTNVDTAKGLTALSPFQVGCVQRTDIENARGNYLPLEVRAHQSADTFSVSEELHGMSFQAVLELSIQHRYGDDAVCKFATAWGGGGGAGSGGMAIPSPDSVLGWSPSLQYRRALQQHQQQQQQQQQGGSSSSNGGQSNNVSPMDEALSSMTSNGNNNNKREYVPLVRVQEPNRILHLGDLLRFVPDSTPTSVRTATPTSTTHNNHNNHGHRGTGGGGGGGPFTQAPPITGVWVVDNTTPAEDVILSWMRRVSSRARESRAQETKWVRYPQHLHAQVLDHALRMSDMFAECFVDADGGTTTNTNTTAVLAPETMAPAAAVVEGGTPPMSSLPSAIRGEDGHNTTTTPPTPETSALNTTTGGSNPATATTNTLTPPQYAAAASFPNPASSSSTQMATTATTHAIGPQTSGLQDTRELAAMVRFRRFRQWRFSLDGYIFFHGVTVRMPKMPLAEILAMELGKVCVGSITQANNNSNANAANNNNNNMKQSTAAKALALSNADRQQQHQHQRRSASAGSSLSASSRSYNNNSHSHSQNTNNHNAMLRRSPVVALYSPGDSLSHSQHQHQHQQHQYYHHHQQQQQQYQQQEEEEYYNRSIPHSSHFDPSLEFRPSPPPNQHQQQGYFASSNSNSPPCAPQQQSHHYHHHHHHHHHNSQEYQQPYQHHQQHGSHYYSPPSPYAAAGGSEEAEGWMLRQSPQSAMDAYDSQGYVTDTTPVTYGPAAQLTDGFFDQTSATTPLTNANHSSNNNVHHLSIGTGASAAPHYYHHNNTHNPSGSSTTSAAGMGGGWNSGRLLPPHRRLSPASSGRSPTMPLCASTTNNNSAFYSMSHMTNDVSASTHHQQQPYNQQQHSASTTPPPDTVVGEGLTVTVRTRSGGSPWLQQPSAGGSSAVGSARQTMHSYGSTYDVSGGGGDGSYYATNSGLISVMGPDSSCPPTAQRTAPRREDPNNANDDNSSNQYYHHNPTEEVDDEYNHSNAGMMASRHSHNPYKYSGGGGGNNNRSHSTASFSNNASRAPSGRSLGAVSIPTPSMQQLVMNTPPPFLSSGTADTSSSYYAQHDDPLCHTRGGGGGGSAPPPGSLQQPMYKHDPNSYNNSNNTVAAFHGVPPVDLSSGGVQKHFYYQQHHHHHQQQQYQAGGGGGEEDGLAVVTARPSETPKPSLSAAGNEGDGDEGDDGGDEACVNPYCQRQRGAYQRPRAMSLGDATNK